MPLLNMTSTFDRNKWCRCTSSLCLMTIGWITSSFNVQDHPLSDEYKIKAVFLYNFAQFVEWPEKAFSQTEPALVIGVLGSDPFGTYLDETVRGEMINNMPLVVKRYVNVSEVSVCHILFVSKVAKENPEAIVS